ncbi:MAG: molybdopterin-dependent oxidoreductase [Oscillospiraceae bacterium]|nr:molybdopterin-dependent oxidoreductase [Oscillospiraceae bacterium]
MTDKIPNAGSGVEIRQTTCDICSPQHHCGVSAYVKDGRLLKVEGSNEHPYSHGSICTKGAAYKGYLYRKDRILHPLRRVGSRGSGEFEEISWEEALEYTAGQLNRLKRQHGADSVLFMNGYGKWQKSYLNRLAFSFGTPNFVGDGCTCQTATHLAWDANVGTLSWPDTDHAEVLLGWALNPYYSNSPNVPYFLRRKKEGLKIIIIDSRITPAAENLADMFLQIRPGTDGALALGMTNLILQNGWEDKEYIREHVRGFSQYAEYVQKFDLQTVSKITGVAENLIFEATRLYATAKAAAIAETAGAITQKINGFQSYRAITCLNAITGNYDRRGGCLPIFYTYNHRYAGYQTRENEFMMSRYPAGARKIGNDRFPIWSHFYEAQANELADYISGEKELQIRGIFGMGMNYRMFPQPEKIRQAIIRDLDFFALSELFMTDTAKLADIVLPACTSFEREEFRCYPGGYGYYSKPAVERVGQSLSDMEILERLAPKLDMDDPLLQKKTARDWVDYIIQDTGWTAEELQKHVLPVKMHNYKEYVPGTYTEQGYNTPSGNFEIASGLVGRYAESHGYSEIPTYDPPDVASDTAAYPLQLVSGLRFPTALNSRLHGVESLRDFVPEPVAEIHPRTAARLAIGEGDRVAIENELGRVVMRARLTARILQDNVSVFHGYSEADVNDLFSSQSLDPYTGFPAFRLTHCRICPAAEEELPK